MADGRRRARLARTLRSTLTRAERAKDTAIGVVKGAQSASVTLQQFRDPQQALTELSARAGDLVDVLTSKMLERDEAASELAFVVEEAVRRRGRDAVLRTVLRRNLLLDGTFLRMLEPMLAGGDAPALPRDALDQGRQTLTTLLAEALDPNTPAPRANREALSRFAASHPDLPMGSLLPALAGELDDEALAGFVFGSYALFLQTFLLRSTVKMMPEMATPRAIDTSTTDDA